MVQSKPRMSSLTARYAGAMAAAAMAVALRWILHPLLGAEFPFALLFLALLPSALYFGLGPSVLALIAGTWASIAISGEYRLLPICMFLLAASLGIYIIGALRRANHRAEESARLAAERLEELRSESEERAIEA